MAEKVKGIKGVRRELRKLAPEDRLVGAVRLAEHLGPGHTIVTILCDYGNRYQSKLFNPVFLENKGLPVPGWLAI